MENFNKALSKKGEGAVSPGTLPGTLLESSVFCQLQVRTVFTGLEKVQNLIAATRQLCNSHPEKQEPGRLESAFAASRSETPPPHEEAPQTSSSWLHMRSPARRNGTKSALRLIRPTRAVCPEQKVKHPGRCEALWEGPSGASMKEQLHWTHRT